MITLLFILAVEDIYHGKKDGWATLAYSVALVVLWYSIVYLVYFTIWLAVLA